MRILGPTDLEFFATAPGRIAWPVMRALTSSSCQRGTKKLETVLV